MVRTCVDSALAELSYLEHLPLISEHSPWEIQMLDDIQTCKLGLRFFRMILWSVFAFEDNSEINQILQSKWGKSRNELVASYSLAKARPEYGNWVLDLDGKIQNCKQTFEESCEVLLRCSLRCNSLKMKLTLKFMDVILKNLRYLYRYKTDNEIVLVKNQMETLEKKLRLFRDLFCLIPKQWKSFKEMQEFKVVVHAFAHYSASIVFMYWVKAIDEEMATKLNRLLFNVMQKIKPCVPVFKGLYFRFLKEAKLMQFDHLRLGQIIQIFLDLLLKDDFQILQESLMFVIAFLVNPPHPDQYAEDEELILITAEIEVLVTEDLYLVLSLDDTKENLFQANECLREFMRKVKLVKGKIQQVYDQIPYSFLYVFPKTNDLGFFDFLLQNLGFLKEKLNRDTNFIPFAKHLIIKIEVELLCLRPYLIDLFEQQKGQTELMATWLNVINLSYRTEHAINSCFVIGHQLWYNMASLMEVLDKIKDVKHKLKKIEHGKMHDGGALHCSTLALGRSKVEDPCTSGFNEEMVGLEKEVDIIVEKLVYGSASFDIVAIVGMPGLGKTALVKNVYNAPVVRHHFHKFAYCVVSQVHNVTKILLDILGDVRAKDDNIYDMPEDGLGPLLRQRLLGNRYLIIMDDIWDVKAWDEVKIFLPKGGNESRVIFTTPIRNVALQAKNDCILHHLRFLSDEESWDLLQKKVFPTRKGCPLGFSEVGKMIAKNCKGLPLTIVSNADHLSRLDMISERVTSYVSTNGCMDVLESSYRHLPEHLKPCFLYFGAFAADKVICVNKLMLLWIAEGFVQNSNNKSLKDVAKDYLHDLVDRSLVIVKERSSYGGIKSCRIHDLVRAFCQEKAQEMNFFRLMDIDEASNSSSFTVRNPYRVWIHMKDDASVHSLLNSCATYHDDYHYVTNLKLVQVMFLEELKWDACFIRRVIASLVHLRFLATSFPLRSRIIIPSSISNLRNLEILILTGKGSTTSKLELPGTIWSMTRLMHVDVGQCSLSSLSFKKRKDYPQMVNLESFSSPYISSTEDLEDLLQRTPSLQKLSFHYALKEGFRFPELDSLGKLESLKVSSARDPSLSSFKFLSTLKKLSLSDCYLNWRSLPVISKMPCLEVLKLLDNAFVWLDCDMDGTEFPKLKFLKLQGLLLTEWIVFQESFPILEVLIVNRCSNLNTVPECFGEIHTLKRIEVYASRKAAPSLVEIQQVQEDGGNEEFEVIVSDYEFCE